MKAIQYTAFGDSSVLHLTQIDKPTVKEDEVLIKIIAVTINPFDIKVRSGNMQAVMPVQLPYLPGSDAAGVVEAVGSKTTRLKVGDEVFATSYGGTFAEFAAIKEAQVALKPTNISANEAVSLAIPIATAYTLLIEDAQLQAGQKILIHGAGGGVGSIMVQIAKALGAYVIGTASGAGVTLVKNLGADEVIDYKTQDFTQLVKDADIVADLVGGETLAKSFSVLKKGGKLLSTVMPPDARQAEKFGVMAKMVMSNPSSKKLDFGKKLVEEGKVKPQVAKTMKLEEAASAQDLVTNGAVNGKIVLEIN